jgi:hypothetical protein
VRAKKAKKNYKTTKEQKRAESGVAGKERVRVYSKLILVEEPVRTTMLHAICDANQMRFDAPKHLISLRLCVTVAAVVVLLCCTALYYMFVGDTT